MNRRDFLGIAATGAVAATSLGALATVAVQKDLACRLPVPGEELTLESLRAARNLMLEQGVVPLRNGSYVVYAPTGPRNVYFSFPGNPNSWEG